MNPMKFRDVNDAFKVLLSYFISNDDLVQEKTRVGSVLRIPHPVLIQYTHPQNQVLLWPNRDANPFFHLYESFWMLAGRNDVKSLAHFNSRMSEYSDDGNILNGAYGYRWRIHFGYDQLLCIAGNLRDNPSCRRQVLAMWDPRSELAYGMRKGKDVCCNTHAYFSTHTDESGDTCLNMTVCNRSNDLVWGLLGANYVHFTALLQHMAYLSNLKVGYYYHFTNNLHTYHTPEQLDHMLNVEMPTLENYRPTPLYNIRRDVLIHRSKTGSMVHDTDIQGVFYHMMSAFNLHKLRHYEKALLHCSSILDESWKIEATRWITKRRDMYHARNKSV